MILFFASSLNENSSLPYAHHHTRNHQLPPLICSREAAVGVSPQLDSLPDPPYHIPVKTNRSRLIFLLAPLLFFLIHDLEEILRIPYLYHRQRRPSARPVRQHLKRPVHSRHRHPDHPHPGGCHPRCPLRVTLSGHDHLRLHRRRPPGKRARTPPPGHLFPGVDARRIHCRVPPAAYRRFAAAPTAQAKPHHPPPAACRPDYRFSPARPHHPAAAIYGWAADAVTLTLTIHFCQLPNSNSL